MNLARGALLLATVVAAAAAAAVAAAVAVATAVAAAIGSSLTQPPQAASRLTRSETHARRAKRRIDDVIRESGDRAARGRGE